MRIYTVVYSDAEGKRRETWFRTQQAASAWAKTPPPGVREVLYVTGEEASHPTGARFLSGGASSKTSS